MSEDKARVSENDGEEVDVSPDDAEARVSRARQDLREEVAALRTEISECRDVLAFCSARVKTIEEALSVQHRTTLGDAIGFLKGMLADGEVWDLPIIHKMAQAEGITPHALRRAKSTLRVRSVREHGPRPRVVGWQLKEPE